MKDKGEVVDCNQRLQSPRPPVDEHSIDEKA